MIDVETEQRLAIPSLSFLLTLECEPKATVARGHIRLLDANIDHAFQSDAALLDALGQYLSGGNH